MNPERTKIERRKAPDFHPCKKIAAPTATVNDL